MEESGKTYPRRKIYCKIYNVSAERFLQFILGNYEMDLSALTKVFPTENFDAGKVLFQQGDLDGDGFIILQGSVELRREENGITQTGIYLYKEEIFGVYKTIFENKARNFTAVTREPSRIIRIPERVLKNKLESTDPFILLCMRNWSELNTRLINAEKKWDEARLHCRSAGCK